MIPVIQVQQNHICLYTRIILTVFLEFMSLQRPFLMFEVWYQIIEGVMKIVIIRVINSIVIMVTLYNNYTLLGIS